MWLIVLAVVLGLVTPTFADDQLVVEQPQMPTEVHVNLDGTTQIFHDQAAAEAHIKERGFDQFPTDHEASRVLQEKADAEFRAQKAQVDAGIEQEIQKAVAGGYVVDINGVPHGSPEALKAREERLNQTYVDEQGGQVWLPQGKKQYLREYQEHVEHVKQTDRENTERLLEGIEPGGVGYEAAQATRALQAQREKDLEEELRQEEERMKKLRPKVLISNEGGRRDAQGK